MLLIYEITTSSNLLSYAKRLNINKSPVDYIAQDDYVANLPQFDKAIATALKSLLDSGASRTTPLALRGAIICQTMLNNHLQYLIR